MWNIDNLKGIIPTPLVNKIKSIPITISNIRDKLLWKYPNIGEYSNKIATWANNESIKSKPKAKLLIVFPNLILIQNQNYLPENLFNTPL